MCPSSCNQPKLQSTPLLQGKTKNTSFLPEILNASIHFPLAREDKYTDPVDAGADCFNPLPSCEGRPFFFALSTAGRMLQSTSLLRGKTSCWLSPYHVLIASIHFPLAREDDLLRGEVTFRGGFNPLPSCEGRQYLPSYSVYGWLLQSTSLLRGKTMLRDLQVDKLRASIHFPLAREDMIVPFGNFI